MKECFLIGAYCNTEERLNDLKKCIVNLKKYNLPILISSHYILPADIIKSVDGFVYDPSNEILYQKDFEKYQSGFWFHYEDSNIIISKSFDFHHDYAFWTQLRNGFSLAKNKEFEMTYFLDFDVELDDETFRELRNGSIGYDSCSYPLNECMYLVVFSCNPSIGLKATESIPTFFEYFYSKSGRTNVESVFHQKLLENNGKLNLIPKNLTDKKNFQNFTSALNYHNNNFYIDGKKLIAGIFPCAEQNNNLYLWANIIENQYNLSIYIEYDGEFHKRTDKLTFLGKLKNTPVNVYANGKLFYTRNIDDTELFKRMNSIQLK